MQRRNILMSITLPEEVSKGREQTLHSVTKEMCKQSGPRKQKQFSCAGKASILHAPFWKSLQNPRASSSVYRKYFKNLQDVFQDALLFPFITWNYFY